MKAKVLSRYKDLNLKSKMTNNGQVIEYLEDGDEENNEFNQEVIKINFPGNSKYNFNRRLSDEDLEPISVSFMTCVVNLTSVNLSYNRITDGGIEILSKLLEFAENISEVNLMGNQIGDEGCRRISSCLVGKIFLYSLNLNTNQIGNAGVMHINDLLLKNPGLLKLDIGSNCYDWDGLIAVTCAMKEVNTTLQVLNVDDPAYKIQDQDFFTHFGNMFRKNDSLRKISMRLHKIRFEGISIMSHYLRTYNKTLQVLDLTGNQICFQGIKYISEYLADTECLKSLILASNSMHNEGAKVFSLGISLNYSLIHVDLTSNSILDEGLCRLAEGLMENASVKSLKLFWNNRFGSDSIAMFYKYLKYKGSEFYPDFVVYVDETGEMGIAHLETHIPYEYEYLVC
jgi:Ran GTPase-activating protein (RanGAP) involved in mRNA processing and transport